MVPPTNGPIGRRTPDDALAHSRAQQRDLVRRGYDAVSHAYRSDLGESSRDGAETTATGAKIAVTKTAASPQPIGLISNYSWVFLFWEGAHKPPRHPGVKMTSEAG